ncbi:hypothetical protein O3P69_006447 [Scylla paramamosain]|uniref:Uncharacterized protein n=1 Tax=Scylla paramamosain TaxID=85552 RepID=A0AAW0U414_SCYPA
MISVCNDSGNIDILFLGGRASTSTKLTPVEEAVIATLETEAVEGLPGVTEIIGPDWLLDRVESRPEKEVYKKALEYVRNLRVVNDIAERGVNMMNDFANVITTDPKQREYFLHAVEYCRRRFESFKKQTLNK